jgi:hypothetical protein
VNSVQVADNELRSILSEAAALIDIAKREQTNKSSNNVIRQKSNIFRNEIRTGSDNEELRVLSDLDSVGF